VILDLLVWLILWLFQHKHTFVAFGSLESSSTFGVNTSPKNPQEYGSALSDNSSESRRARLASFEEETIGVARVAVSFFFLSSQP